MSLQLYNTLTRNKQTFVPLEEGQAGMYTCGPTVYDYAHIGNFRAYMFEDLLRRYLRYRGFKVTQVMNFTDVDDKTIRGALEHGRPLSEYTQTYKDAFFEDIDILHIERAEFYPAATEHIGDMIELVQQLEDKGFAYRTDDGSVYFSIERFPEYGKLARIDKSGMRAGARVAQDEYEKENVADFALWKAWDEADGDVGWDSPWGRGRPGWHIECSAMSRRYLGETFDIHTGGIDNMFPHHEDEIAQSEAASGKPFVRFWLHCAHLIVEGEKMSKSLGNFFTLRQILDKGYTGREVRYVLIGTHYRQPLNFTFESLKGARSALKRIDDFTFRLEHAANGGDHAVAPPTWARDAVGRIEEALDDDLNISGAVGALFDMIREGNRLLDEDAMQAEEAAAMLQLLSVLDGVFGFLQPERGKADEETMELVCLREKARTSKDWQEADRLREQIEARGWSVKDTPSGSELRRI